MNRLPAEETSLTAAGLPSLISFTPLKSFFGNDMKVKCSIFWLRPPSYSFPQTVNCIKVDLSVTFQAPSNGLAGEHGKKTGSLESSKPERWWITLSDNEARNMTGFGNGFLSPSRKSPHCVGCCCWFVFNDCLVLFYNGNEVRGVISRVPPGGAALRGRAAGWNPSQRMVTTLSFASKRMWLSHGWIKSGGEGGAYMESTKCRQDCTKYTPPPVI